MIDEWSGLADILANLIEEYASDLDIENLPDITVDNHTGDEIKKKNCRKIKICVLLLMITRDIIDMIRVSKLLL